MKHASRLFLCLRCHVQVVICSYCDRGHVYCGASCAHAARQASCRMAEQRYQNSSKGRIKHALRQRFYRARLKEKVTDQGSLAPAQDGLLDTVKNKPVDVPLNPNKMLAICCFCKKAVPAWLRQDFIRHGVLTSARHLAYLRPP